MHVLMEHPDAFSLDEQLHNRAGIQLGVPATGNTESIYVFVPFCTTSVLRDWGRLSMTLKIFSQFAAVVDFGVTRWKGIIIHFVLSLVGTIVPSALFLESTNV